MTPKPKIFISRNFDGKINSIVISRSRELAEAFWQGKDIAPFSVSEMYMSVLDDHPTGIIEILKTKEHNFGTHFDQNIKIMVDN